MTVVVRVREQLLSTAGVCPSDHWLDDCWAQCVAGSGRSDEEAAAAAGAVLEQILHHDLRDVVRACDDDNQQQPASASLQLQAAVRQSLASEEKKAVLPESFRLLVQVEELLDVSLNAEQRYAVGPASSSAPTPVGNQRKRCLKICYTDGYSTEPLFAMETTPVTDLSVQSLAGLKILLTGPVTIRHGVAAWHPGNCTVLGGHVPELVDIQRQALQLARKKAGHGIDPTIRALCPDRAEDDDDEERGEGDEGEYESRDVEPPPPVQQQQQYRSMPPPPPPIQQNPAPPQHYRPPVQRQIPPPPPPPPPQRQNAPQYSPPPPQRAGEATGTQPPHRHLPRGGVNPYASSQSQQSPVPSRHPTNPYQQRSNTVSMSTTPPPPPAAFQSPPAASARTTTTTGPPAMAFGELRSMLRRAVNDRNMYQLLVGKTWRVRMRQKGVKLYFNIEKNKEMSEGGGEKKYEYAMVSKFEGDDCQDLLTCKVASSILEPFFSKSPGEMRKLNKQDKAQAEILVREGGKSVQSSMLEYHWYEVTFLLTSDEFFGSSDADRQLDGRKPILSVFKQRAAREV